MSIAKLKIEIAADPNKRGYATMTDDQIVSDLKAKTRTKTVPIPSTKLLGWAAGNGRYQKISDMAADTTKPGSLRSVARAAEKMFSLDSASLDLSKPKNVAFVGALVASGVLTAADERELVALGESPISRAEELGLGLVRVGELQQARI